MQTRSKTMHPPPIPTSPLRTTALLLLLCALLAPQPLQAKTSTQRKLQRAFKLYDKLQFTLAYQLLEPLARDPELTRKQRAKVYLYQGLCLFYLKGKRAARKRIIIALRLDTNSKLPRQTPPPLRRMFQEELRRIRPKVRPRPRPRDRIIRRQPPPQRLPTNYQLDMKASTPVFPGQRLRFEGECSPHPPNTRLYIFIRRKGQTSYRKYPLLWKGERCTGQYPNPYNAQHQSAGTIEFRVEVRHKGNLLQQSHPLHRPGQIPLSLKARPNGWLIPVLIGAGILVAAGGVATYFLLQPQRPGVQIHIDLSALKHRPLHAPP